MAAAADVELGGAPLAPTPGAGAAGGSSPSEAAAPSAARGGEKQLKQRHRGSAAGTPTAAAAVGSAASTEPVRAAPRRHSKPAAAADVSSGVATAVADSGAMEEGRLEAADDEAHSAGAAGAETNRLRARMTCGQRIASQIGAFLLGILMNQTGEKLPVIKGRNNHICEAPSRALPLRHLVYTSPPRPILLLLPCVSNSW